MNSNREIYNNNYSAENLKLKGKTAYDKYIVNLRFSLIRKYGDGKDVLDLCCGTGTYLIPMLNIIKSAIGVDFSSNMLREFRKNFIEEFPTKLILLEEDATCLSLKDASVDFVFSYTSLYYIPEVDKVIKEIARVLRPDGIAVFELGNIFSLNTLVCNIQHKELGWAKPYHISVNKMKKDIKDAGFYIVDWKAFQISPMCTVPSKLMYLFPLLNVYWKKVLGIKVFGRVLDEWISSFWILKFLAFRHVFVVRKV